MTTARYETIDTSPWFLAVDLEAASLPGTFAHTRHPKLDHDVDYIGKLAQHRCGH